jgi:hypothetical protein
VTLGLALPAAATVAPPTPEQIVMSAKREALESSARRAFGDVGLFERLRDWRKTWGYILIGRRTRAARQAHDQGRVRLVRDAAGPDAESVS